MTCLDDIDAYTLHLLLQRTPNCTFSMFLAILIIYKFGERGLCDLVAFLKFAILTGMRLYGIIGKMY